MLSSVVLTLDIWRRDHKQKLSHEQPTQMMVLTSSLTERASGSTCFYGKCSICSLWFLWLKKELLPVLLVVINYSYFLFHFHSSFKKNISTQLKQQEHLKPYNRNQQSSAWLLPSSAPDIYLPGYIQQMRNGAGQEEKELTFKLLICVSGTLLDTLTYKVSMEIFCVNKTSNF